MIQQFIHRPANERGQVNAGWLQARHSFSFSEYRDPNWMRFGNLRVLNDDIVGAGQGFGMHPHQNAEIFSYLIEGALEHQDSMRNTSIVSAGNIQFMSAGSGVMHAEMNPSETESTRLLQIWLLPAVTGTTPSYQNYGINPADKAGKLKLFLSHDGRDGSIRSHADADVYCATLTDEQQIVVEHPNSKGWVQVAKGRVHVNGRLLNEGDGLAIEGAGKLTFSDAEGADFLYFRLSDAR